MTVAGRQRRIRQQNGVPAGHHEPRVPPPRPPVPAADRTTVDPQQQRRRRVGAGVRRQRQPGTQRRAVLGGGPDLSERARDGDVGLRAEQGDGLLLLPRRVEPNRGRRRVDGRPQREQGAPVRAHDQVGVRAGGREPDDRAAAEIQAEDRRAAAFVGEEVEERAVGGERRVARPGGRISRQHLPGLVGGEVEHLQRAPRSGVPVAEGLLQVGQAAPVRGESGVGEPEPVGREDAPLTAGGVDDRERAVVSGAPLVDPPLDRDRPAVGRDGEALADIPARVRGQVAHGGQPSVADRGGLGEQDVRLVRPEVVVPVSDRVALVQDRRHSGVLARLSPLLVVLDRVRARQRRRGERDVSRVAGHGDVAHRATAPRHLARLACLWKQPQRRAVLGVLVRLGLRIRAARGEQQPAVREERRVRLAGRRAGQPARGSLAARIDLPQRGGEALPVRCPRRHGGHEPDAVRGEGKSAEPP